MTFIQIVVLLSAAFSVAAYVPFITAVWKTRHSQKPVQPQRATWFVWWLIDVVATVALASAEAWNAVPLFAAFTFGSSIVLILSIKYGEGGFTKFDLACITIAVAGVTLWQALGSEHVEIAVAASMIAAWVGTLPTLIKDYKNPEGDDRLTWVLFAIGGFLNVLAIPSFTFVEAGPTISVFTAQLAINIAISLGYRRKKRLWLEMIKTEVARS